MVAVVSGGGLGVSNSSRFTVGAGGELGQGALGRAGERITVNAANGNLVIQNQDGQLAGIGADIALLRTYNSQGGWEGDNGDAWRLGYYRRIGSLTGTLNTAGSTLRRTDADGLETTPPAACAGCVSPSAPKAASASSWMRRWAPRRQQRHRCATP